MLDAPPTKAPVTTMQITSGALFGLPAATVGVWYLNTFTWPGQIPVEVAAAIGSLVSVIFSSVWHLGAQLFAKFGLHVQE